MQPIFLTGHSGDDLAREIGVQAAFEREIEADQMHMDRLDGSRFRQARMLRGIGVHGHAMNAHIGRVAVLPGQQPAIERPASGRSAKIGVPPAIDGGQDHLAIGTDVQGFDVRQPRSVSPLALLRAPFVWAQEGGRPCG